MVPERTSPGQHIYLYRAPPGRRRAAGLTFGKVMNYSGKGLKLLISYDVKPDSMQMYYQFVLGRYIPVLQSLGLEMSEAWHTAYGNWPNRLVGFVSRDAATMRQVMGDDTWRELNEQLEEYVTDLRYKVIPYEEGFQF
jgi:hypothetical protein